MCSDPPFEHCSHIIGWLTSKGIVIKKVDLHGVDLKNIADPVIVINIPPLPPTLVGRPADDAPIASTSSRPCLGGRPDGLGYIIKIQYLSI